MKVYLYIWFKPDWSPFYVGIGKTKDRWNPVKTKEKDRNTLCFNIVKKYGAENIKVQRLYFDTWEDAAAAERSLIACFGRMDMGGILANFTDGGEGNVNPPQDERERKRIRLKDPNNPMREQHKVLNTDPDIKAKRVAAIRSLEVQEKIKAKLNDPEAKASRLAKLRATINSPEYQAKLALRRKPKLPKKTKEEISRIRSENMRKLNTDKTFVEKRIANLKAASDKISIGVLASMEKRLQTMQMPETQAKLRKPKTPEARRKMSLNKKEWWAKRKGLI